MKQLNTLLTLVFCCCAAGAAPAVEAVWVDEQKSLTLQPYVVSSDQAKQMPSEGVKGVYSSLFPPARPTPSGASAPVSPPQPQTTNPVSSNQKLFPAVATVIAVQPLNEGSSKLPKPGQTAKPTRGYLVVLQLDHGATISTHTQQLMAVGTRVMVEAQTP